jgi:membrane protein implicated in regulation of membrane protease activity
MEFIQTYAWVFWLGLILLFVIIEMFTLEFTFLMLAVGSVAGLASGLLGTPWYLQIVIAAVVSVLLILLLRPPLLRRLKRGADPAKSNVDALLGLDGVVVSTVTTLAGQVKLANGDIWTARLAAGVAVTDLVRGERVEVAAIDGATALVAPSPRKEPIV